MSPCESSFDSRNSFKRFPITIGWSPRTNVTLRSELGLTAATSNSNKVGLLESQFARSNLRLGKFIRHLSPGRAINLRPTTLFAQACVRFQPCRQIAVLLVPVGHRRPVAPLRQLPHGLPLRA